MNYVNHNKVKFKSKILKSIFLYIFLYVCFSCVYIKMPKTLSAKYYQVNKKILQKKACQRYQNLSKEEKKKSGNIVVNVTKFSKDEKQKLVDYRGKML